MPQHNIENLVRSSQHDGQVCIIGLSGHLQVVCKTVHQTTRSTGYPRAYMYMCVLRVDMCCVCRRHRRVLLDHGFCPPHLWDCGGGFFSVPTCTYIRSINKSRSREDQVAHGFFYYYFFLKRFDMSEACEFCLPVHKYLRRDRLSQSYRRHNRLVLFSQRKSVCHNISRP